MAEITIIPAKNRSDEIIRTAAYARVSSDSEDQLNSFAAQIRYYTEMLQNSTNTVFVDMYADEGITGTSTAKRTEFQRLMNDCRKGKIDRILAKSISRFARNTKDSLRAARELKTLGVSVYFEKENIDTGEISSEMLLAIYSQFAQEESMSISRNCRLGIKKRMMDGTYKTATVPYGYDYSDGKVIVNKEQANIVQVIFNEYLNGKGEFEIAALLNNLNSAKPVNAKEWYPQAISSIISNEWYIGDRLLQKKYSEDTIPFKRKVNHGEKEELDVDLNGSVQAAQRRVDELAHNIDELIKLATVPESAATAMVDIEKFSEEMKALREFIEAEKLKQAKTEQSTAELDMVMKRLENEDFVITEYDDVVVRQLIEKVTVMDKNTITVTFKGGFEIRKELDSGN